MPVFGAADSSSLTPYTPTPFASPIANPAVGGAGRPYPYVSNSQYAFAPTAMDVLNLVPGGNAATQAQSLADTLRRASAWADRVCFGADASAKGASLCATISVETDMVPVTGSELRLVCDYKPVVAVNGIDIGTSLATLSPIGPVTQQRVRVGRRTIYVPLGYFSGRSGDVLPANSVPSASGRMAAVWSYVNGYPHSQLTAAITAGQDTCTVAPTDGATGLLGLVPGATQMTIVDGSATETFTVSSVSGTTITSTTPFLNNHPLPTAPDFTPVTSLPADVSLAVIFLATTLIKTRGDNSLVLDEIHEPKQIQAAAGNEFTDLTIALDLLMPFRVRIKGPRR